MAPAASRPSPRAREGGRLADSRKPGELIRQEQEAGIAPVPADLNHRHARGLGGLPTSGAAAAAAGVTASATHGDDSGEAGEAGEGQGLADGAEVEEPVHARGPSVIGMEDMGPQTPGSGLQGGIQLEGPMGMRREEPEGLVETGDEGKKDGASKEQTHGETDEAKDSDKKAVTADPDGVVEGEKGKGETGVEKGSDAVDGTTL
ncbi:uncharacterized protein KY384_001593 [Bacidia gigantensis]|uniref:uncharacterized protein n=1 Tax=Bacidia gigantensis TaxID=2732470 RepID=UPI001D03909B|nr:uncharacterized protein KY384_001593 [Bacidia gigantensis]KAG8533852.1 hypothetical protein KY384_001593 [Bacidia gigantensis]